jgi:hypothetical protein
MRESQGDRLGARDVPVYSACPRGWSTYVLVSYWPYQARPAGRLAPIWRCGALPPQTSADRLHLCYQASRSDTVLSRLRNDPRVTAAGARLGGAPVGRGWCSPRSVGHPVLPGLASAASCFGWSQALMSWAVTRHRAAAPGASAAFCMQFGIFPVLYLISPCVFVLSVSSQIDVTISHCLCP